ncbi:MAG: hypothetical protein ABF291_15810 [Desulfobacterales bacterium]
MDSEVINHKSVAAVVGTYLQRSDIRTNLELLCRCLPPTAEMFVAGGAIRNLVIEMIHGGAPPTYDIDLFIGGVAGDESLIDRLSALDVRPTELGGWRWHPPGSALAFDFCLLPNFIIIAKYRLAPTLANLLASIDLSVNAVIYDIFNKKLYENRCIDSIKQKIIDFNTRRLVNRLLLVYRILLIHHKIGFRLSEQIFAFLKLQNILETLNALKPLLVNKQGKAKTRAILAEYDRICRFHSYTDYLRA